MNMKPAAAKGVKAATFHVALSKEGEAWTVALSGDGEEAADSNCASGPSMDVAFTRALARFRVK